MPPAACAAGLGPISTSYFCKQYCDKKEKRYCDIWQFLATYLYWPTKVSSCQNLVYLVLGFDKSLPWLGIEFYALKISMSFYHFYINIVWKAVILSL